MAISTPTRHASSATTTNATSYSLGTFTYTAGRLYLLFIVPSDTLGAPDTTPDPTGTGQTWTRIDAGEGFSGDFGVTCYRFLPSSTVTAQNTSTSVLSTTHEGICWAIVEIASGFDTSGTNGSGAITTYTAIAPAGSATGYTMTIPAPAAGAVVVSGIVHSTAETAIPVAGWFDFSTPIDDSHGAPARGFTVFYDDTSPSTSPGATWVTSTGRRAMAVELKAAPSGPVTLPGVAVATTLAGGITGANRGLPQSAGLYAITSTGVVNLARSLAGVAGAPVLAGGVSTTRLTLPHTASDLEIPRLLTFGEGEFGEETFGGGADSSVAFLNAGLLAAGGAYVLAGGTAQIQTPVFLSEDAGLLVLQGGAAAFSITETAVAGTIVLQPSTALTTATLTAAAGQFVVAGGSSSIPLLAGAGEVVVVGTAVGMGLSLGATILGTMATVELVSSSAALIDFALPAVAGTLVVTGGGASVGAEVASATAGLVQVAGGDATLSAGATSATAGTVAVAGGVASLSMTDAAAAGTLALAGGDAATSAPTPNEAGVVQIIGGVSTVVFSVPGNGSQIALNASAAALAQTLNAGAGVVTISMGGIRGELIPRIYKTGSFSFTIRMNGLAPSPVKLSASSSTTLTKRGTWETP